MKRGLLPGGTRGANYRQHVHLAVSHRPEAGLREGSDLILMVDLMRAHSAGCVFYISNNNVVLTADCIPPSCIVRATCTSTGAAFDLNQFRAKYMRGCAESTWGLSARAALCLMITLSAAHTRLLISSCGRCLLQPTFAQPGALISRPSYRDESRCSGHLMLTPDMSGHQEGQSTQPRGKEQVSKSVLPTGTSRGGETVSRVGTCSVSQSYLRDRQRRQCRASSAGYRQRQEYTMPAPPSLPARRPTLIAPA